MLRDRKSRPGITLVEMMVAMALSLGIMLILTESFKMALDFVRGANSTGELIYQLNGAGNVITRDLQAPHFLAEDNKPGQGLKLSNQRFDLGAPPPKSGFFKIVAPNPNPGPSFLPETTDAFGFNINYPAVNHQLHFTTVLPGGTDQNLFTVLGGGITYPSRAAEVAYFLVPTGLTHPSDPKRQQLFNLVRRQRIVALTTDEQTNMNSSGITTAVPNAYEVVSLVGANLNTMSTLTNAANRLSPLTQLPGPTPGPQSPRYGEDILLSNVLSFEIQADCTPTVSGGFSVSNTDAPYGFLSALPNSTFDTGSVPQPTVRVKSLQITIRMYDPRLKQTRQNTWKIAM